MSRHRDHVHSGFRPGGPASRRLATWLVAAMLVPTAVLAGSADVEAPVRPWGFGWDPGDSGQGLTLRYRPTPNWDVSISGGPDDYRSDSTARLWDSDEDILDDGTEIRDDYRVEQGWVRLTAGRRFWHHQRVSVSAVCGATYRWSHAEDRTRDYRQVSSDVWDFHNTRMLEDVGNWTVSVGIRPSWDVTERIRLEFEAGVAFRRITTDSVSETWWDSAVATIRSEETRHTRYMNSYGGFELARLKFIFWF